MENEQKFLTDNYDDPIRNQTVFKLFKIAPDISLKYPQLIQETELNLGDSLLSIGLLFRKALSSFNILEKNFEPYYPTYVSSENSKSSWRDQFTTQVDYYHDQDLQKVSRVVYNILGFLRDVGGLWGALQGIFNGIVFILTFNGLYQLLTSRLYRVNFSAGSYREGQNII